MLVGWIVRLLLMLGSLIAGTFVAKDALNFQIWAGIIAMLLFALFVFALAFWPARWSHFLNRT